jgi:hypothetical protein
MFEIGVMAMQLWSTLGWIFDRDLYGAVISRPADPDWTRSLIPFCMRSSQCGMFLGHNIAHNKQAAAALMLRPHGRTPNCAGRSTMI